MLNHQAAINGGFSSEKFGLVCKVPQVDGQIDGFSDTKFLTNAWCLKIADFKDGTMEKDLHVERKITLGI